MPYQFLPYDVLLWISAAVTLVLGGYGYRCKNAPGAKAFVASMAIGSLWSIANSLEVSATTLEHMLFWANVQYFAYTLAPVAWIVMVFQFSGRAHWVSKRNIILVLIIPTVTLFLVWTDSIHGLVRNNIRLDTSGVFPVIAKEYGPWFWVHFGQSYFLNFLSAYLLLKTIVQKNMAYRTQSVYLLFGISLVLIFNLLYVTGVGPIKRFDISPIIFSISGTIIAWGILRFRIFDLVPLARNNVIEAMKNMVIVIDTMDRIVDVNPATKDMFFADYNQSLFGKPLGQLSADLAALATEGDKPEVHQKQFDQVVNGIQRHFEIYVSQINDYSGALIGRVIVINDTTELKKAQEQLNREKQELAVMAERDRMAKDLHDNLGQILSFAGIQIQAAQIERQRGNQKLADSYLKRLGEIINGAHQEMRDYVYNVRISEYEKAGIERLLKDQIGKFVDNSSTFTYKHIALEVNNHDFSTDQKIHLVNIVKEALNNIMKHAEATAVRVALALNGSEHQLIIEDNGLGFAGSDLSGTCSRQTGSGLYIMEERARLLGGSLNIASEPGKLTRITVLFPDDRGGHSHENYDCR